MLGHMCRWKDHQVCNNSKETITATILNILKFHQITKANEVTHIFGADSIDLHWQEVECGIQIQNIYIVSDDGGFQSKLIVFCPILQNKGWTEGISCTKYQPTPIPSHHQQ